MSNPLKANSPGMVLPNFICPGTAKSGTTSLYEILIQHPDIYLSKEKKEAHFFDYDANYSKGLGWYSKTFFSEHKNEKAIGDITPLYMYLPDAVDRIYGDLGEKTRFIFMLRNPVDRAYSHYLFNVKRGFENEPFADALSLESKRLKRDFSHRVRYRYADGGMYGRQLGNFLKYWPRENMLFVLFEEDFLQQRAKTISDILEFLDVAQCKLELQKHANAHAVPRFKWLTKMLYGDSTRKLAKKLVYSQSIRRKIFGFMARMNEKRSVYKKLDPQMHRQITEKYFKDDIHTLEKMINRNLSCWLN